MASGKKANDTVKSATLEALAHPLRQRIMGVILDAGEASGPLSPRQISSELGEPLSKVSYHVRVLARCGAVSLTRTRQVRGSVQHFYAPSRKFMSLPWVPPLLETFTHGVA